MSLTLDLANAILAGALAEAARLDAKPLGVVVLDAGGHPIAFQRQDGASLFRLDIARGKATGALGMGADSALLAERAKANPIFFASVSNATHGALVLSAGGVLVRRDGDIIGAVGISGDTSEIDAACAAAGIRAAGIELSEAL